MVSLSTQRLINKQKQNPCSLIKSRKKGNENEKARWVLSLDVDSTNNLLFILWIVPFTLLYWGPFSFHPPHLLIIYCPSLPSLSSSSFVLFNSIHPTEIKIKIASQINKFSLFIKSFVFCFGCCFCWYMKLRSQYHQLVLPCFISCFLFSLVICIRCFHKLV